MSSTVSSSSGSSSTESSLPPLRESIMCSICIRDITEHKVKTICNHHFHEDCMKSYIATATKLTCPNCRQSLYRKLESVKAPKTAKHPLREDESTSDGEISEHAISSQLTRAPNGDSLLHTAVKQDDLSAVRRCLRLVRSKEWTNNLNHINQTPLQCAKSDEVAVRLLKCGADPYKGDWASRKRPLDVWLDKSNFLLISKIKRDSSEEEDRLRAEIKASLCSRSGRAIKHSFTKILDPLLSNGLITTRTYKLCIEEGLRGKSKAAKVAALSGKINLATYGPELQARARATNYKAAQAALKEHPWT